MGKFKEYFQSKKALKERVKSLEEEIYKMEKTDAIKELAIKELRNERDHFHYENLSLKSDNEKLKEKNKELRKNIKKLEKGEESHDE